MGESARRTMHSGGTLQLGAWRCTRTSLMLVDGVLDEEAGAARRQPEKLDGKVDKGKPTPAAMQ